MNRLGTVLYSLDAIEHQIMRKIFRGVGDDFTDGGKRSVVYFIRLYASDDTVAFLSEAKTAPAIKTLGYVWLLNALN